MLSSSSHYSISTININKNSRHTKGSLMPSLQKMWPLSPEWRGVSGAWGITTLELLQQQVAKTMFILWHHCIMRPGGETGTRCPCVFAKQPIMVKANPEIIDPPPLLCRGLLEMDIPWPDFGSFNTSLRLDLGKWGWAIFQLKTWYLDVWNDFRD